jgi:PKD repeat protein
VSHSLRVNAPPTAAFTASPSVQQLNQSISFTSTSSDPEGGSLDYSWAFGDGATSTQQNPSHSYSASGTKTVTLTVTDSDGATAFVQHTVRVNAPPTPKITYAALDKFTGQDSQKPFVGERVAFSASTSTDPDGDPKAATYQWDFNGDNVYGDVPAAQSLIKPLSTPGDITVGVQMTDVDGATATARIPIHVDQPPVPGFTWSPLAPLTGQTVTFTSTSTDPDGAGDILSQNWDLNGDGDFSDASGPTARATFLTAGNYKVSLQVTDQTRVVSTATQTVSVTGAPAPTPPATPGGPVVVERPFQPPSSGSSSSGGGGAGGTAADASVPGDATSRTLPVLAGVRVSIAGSVAPRGTQITRLFVVAPRGATVRATCTGKGCPAKRERRKAGKGGVRLRKFERTFRGPAKVAVTITKSGFIGRYILFTFRRGKAPVRGELCLAPGARAAARCPAS